MKYQGQASLELLILLPLLMIFLTTILGAELLYEKYFQVLIQGRNKFFTSKNVNSYSFNRVLIKDKIKLPEYENLTSVEIYYEGFN